VMLDQNSIVIHYDYLRGEPRGNIKKDSALIVGDCIDCNLCIDVCPTGIDIRNGTQLECVNCTACIDACNYVMEKVKRPKGLVRYASKNEIEIGKRSIFTPRAIGYTLVLMMLTFLILFLLLNRSEIELNILRSPGLLFQEQPGNKISNLYDVKIVNKSFNYLQVDLEVENLKPAEIKLIGDNLKVDAQAVVETKFFVILPKTEIKILKTPLKIAAKSNGKILDIIQTSFLGKVK